MLPDQPLGDKSDMPLLRSINGGPARPMTLGELRRKMQDGTLTDEEKAEAEKAFSKLAGVVAQGAADISKALAPLRDFGLAIDEMVGRAMATLNDAFAPMLAGLGEALRKLPSKLREAVLALGQRGWFIDPWMGHDQLWKFEALLLAGKVSEVDDLLMDHFDNELDAVEAAIAKECPQRAALIGSALRAHRRGEFELSIPVLLAQADGICKDATARELFMSEAGLPKSAAYVAALGEDDIGAALLSAIAIRLPINMSARERDRHLAATGESSWHELNRHVVLHGEQVDYGTRLNGCKAISLVAYLSGLLGPNSRF